MQSVGSIVSNISKTIVNPILALLFAVAILIFIYGIVEYLMALDGLGDTGKRESGIRHIVWGLVGMAIMLCATSIYHLIGNTVGVTLP